MGLDRWVGAALPVSGAGEHPGWWSLCHPSSGDISELWGGLGGGSEPLACRQLLAVCGGAEAQGAARGLCSNESGCSEWGPAVTSRGAAVHSSFNEVPSPGPLLCGSVPWPHHCPLCWLGVQDQLHHPQCCAGVQLGGMGAARAARETSLSGGGGLLSCAENAVSGKWPWGPLTPTPCPGCLPGSAPSHCAPQPMQTPQPWQAGGFAGATLPTPPGHPPPHPRPACPQDPPVLLPVRMVGAGAGPELGRGLHVPGSVQAAGSSVWGSPGVWCPSLLPQEAGGGLQAPGSRKKLSRCLWLYCISRGAPAGSRP